jgi:hypothetical protein
MHRVSLLLSVAIQIVLLSTAMAATFKLGPRHGSGTTTAAETSQSGQPDGEIIPVQATVWDELIRLDVGDLADRDIRPIGDDRKMHGVRVCAEENKVRIRRAEVMVNNNRWQRLFLPLALAPGECSDEIEILGGPRQLKAVQFDYEAWSAGYDRATLVIYGRPDLEK